MSDAKLDLVQGWKNIAAYVDRDVSTVKRWEQRRGLPVRRIPGEGRANVYAHAAELSQWLSGVEASAPAIALPAVANALDPTPALPSPAHVGNPSPLSRSGFRRHPVALVGVAALVCGGVLSSQIHHLDPHASASTRPGSQSTYTSPIPGVQQTYLRGEYLYDQRTPDTMRLALTCFQDATRKDPADAEAWSGLANAYLLLHEYGVVSLEAAYPPLKAAADRAIAIQPSLSEPHATLGFADFFWWADIPAAEQEFGVALRLGPSSASVHSRYGAMLTYEARFPEALAHLDLAQQLDPKSTAILANRAFALGLSGRRDEALNLLQQVGYNDRNASVLHHLGVLAEVRPRNLPLYLDQFKRLSEFRHDEYGQTIYREADRTLRASGETAMWHALLTGTQRVTPQPNTVTLDLIRYEAFLGENDNALDDLAIMASAHKAALVGMLIDPAFVSLHHDPRFARLIADLGLPPVSSTGALPRSR